MFDGLLVLIMAYFVFVLIIAIVIYIYSSLTLMIVAKNTNTPRAWRAWIPIGNLILTANIAQMPWWPVTLILMVFVCVLLSVALPSLAVMWIIIAFLFSAAFMVYYYIWWWKICVILGKPGWYPLLSLIPYIGAVWALILWGMLAWGSSLKTTSTEPEVSTPVVTEETSQPNVEQPLGEAAPVVSSAPATETEEITTAPTVKIKKVVKKTKSVSKPIKKVVKKTIKKIKKKR